MKVEQEIARISASQPRRIFGVGSLAILGGMLLYIAMSNPADQIVWQIFLLVLGGLALFLSQKMWTATAVDLILTDTELREEGGLVIAEIANVAKVERGMFAMKPSNGFNIFLKTSEESVWRPGLWWRLGRRVAIGGVVSGAQTKPVADIMTVKVVTAQND